MNERLHLVRGTPRRWAVFLLGVLLLAPGVALAITADVGLSSWQLLETGLVMTTGASFGAVVIAESVAALALAWWWLDERPGPGTLVIALAIGPLVGVLLDVFARPATTTGQLVMLCVGTLLLGAGLGLYIAADVGPSAQDSLFTGVMRRYGWRPATTKLVIDLVIGLAGVALGSRLGIGTVVLTFALPVVVERMLTVGHALAGTTLGATEVAVPLPEAP